MASRANENEEDIVENGDAPLIDLNDATVKKLLAKAKRRGFLTYDELNAALPQDQMSSEQIEDVMSAINDMGVQIVENDEAGEDGEEEEQEEEVETIDNISENDPRSLTNTIKKTGTGERTDDPVRMYLREMGAVELLSREGEIAIAKRIESGRDTMILGLCESPITFHAIIDWSNALNDGEMQLREILDLDAMLSKEPAPESLTEDGEEEGDGEISEKTAGPSYKEEEEVEDEVVAESKSSKKQMVPKARLDEVLAKQKALQKQLDEMTAQNEKSAEAPDAYDFDSKEVEYQNMVLDGETEKAVALRREIRKAERAQLEFEMRQEMNQTVSQDRQMTALQNAAAAMEEAYPVFDSNSDVFDQEITNEVIDLRDAFILKGYDAVDALSKAVKYVVKDHDLDQAQESVPSLAGKAQKTDELARKRAQVSKKLRAAEAQPPELPGESSSNHGEKGLDLSSMTEEEFAALPEATLKRLRGDIL